VRGIPEYPSMTVQASFNALGLNSEIAPPAILTLHDRVLAHDGDPWALVQQALSYAVEAYQKLAVQSAQIDYLQSLSVTDPLTGLANRRGFETELERALALATRHGETGVLALLDLDNLKYVNDRHGHAAGDVLLQACALAMVQGVRTTDVVARLGGDEFALILLRTRPAEGHARARNLQAHLNRTTAGFDGAVLPLQVSMGVVPYAPDAEADQLLLAVDAQMYRDKSRRAASHPLRQRRKSA
jgi:diguanylate cyclase (GGDEF)-like protein